MKHITSFFVLVVFVFAAAVPAQAAWTVVSSGNDPVITDGNWTLTLYGKTRAKYKSHEENGSTVLDLTTVNADLESGGSTLRVTEIDQQAFYQNSIVTEVYLPDYITKLGKQSFMYCPNLTTVCISANAVFVDSHVFACSPNLETVYYNGATPETGTVQIPLSVTDIKNNVFEHGSGYNNGNTNRKIKKIIAPGITEIKGTAFQSCAALEYVYAPKATKIGANAFQHCVALDTVVISPSLNFIGALAFENSGIATLYPDGQDNPEVGTIFLPSTVTTMDNYGHFMGTRSRFTKVVARGMTIVPNRAFQNAPELVSVEFSPNLAELRTNASNSDQSPFYNCAKLASFSPAVWGPMVVGQGTFRSCGSLTTYLDLSGSGITEIPSMWAAQTSLDGVTFPSGLTAFAGDQNFRELKKGAKFRFLGDRPTVTTTGDKSPFYTKDKNNVNQRHVFVVDAAAYPAWTNGTDFVAMADIASNSDTKGAFLTTSADFPATKYPDEIAAEEVLGATIWGSGNGRYNWVVQYVDHSKFTATFVDEDGTTVLGTDDVEVGNHASYSGSTPTKASTDEFEYTFAGWSPDPATTVVNGDTTFTATYTASTRSYTITWKLDANTDIDTTSVAYGDTPAHADATKPSDENYSYTFAGWSTDGENVITIPAVTGAATYIAVFQRHDASSTVTVSWFDEDGTTALVPATTTVLKDSQPTHAEPAKDATVNTVYTFAGWKVVGGDDTVYATADLPPATADVSYKAYFTSAARKYTVAFLDYDGGEISTVAIDYGSEASVVEAAKPADPTRAATAEYTYTFGGWTPAFAAVTGEATYTATYTETANEYTASFVDEDGTTVLKDAVTYAYGDTVVPPDDPTKEGYTFAGWAVNETVVEDFTMPAADTTYTATYAINKYTITWLNANGDALTTTQVEHDSTPAYPGTPVPTMTATAKMSYAFAGIWTPEIEAAVSNTTYTAVYNTAFLSPLAIKRTSAVYDNGAGEATVVTEVVNGGTGAETTAEAAATQRTAKVEGEATVEGTTVTSVFDGFIAGRGYEWTITATQTYGAEFDGASESASIKGRTYARKSRTWFECSPVEWNDGAFAPGSASGSGAQVRLHATVTFPAILPRALLEGGNAVVGITAYQPNAGVAPCYYAWDGAQWVRLAGVAPKGGVAVELLGVVDFARKDGAAVAWYADGYQLTTEVGDWEVPLVGSAAKLESFGLVGDLTVGSLSGDYDVGGLGFSLIIR